MNMNDVVFTSYAFGPLYVYQQMELERSIRKIYPDANIRFWHNDDGSSLAVCNVPGAKTFHESMYGFKVHCVRNCLAEGFKVVIFLDAAMQLEDAIDDVLDVAHTHGVLCTDERTMLSTVISDKCLEHVGKTRDEVAHLHLVGGSLYIFDFTNPVTDKIFGCWYNMEQAGIFGSEEDDVRGLLDGHRKDETCMALALDKYGVQPQGFDTCGYHNLGGGNAVRKFTFYKLHFKRIGEFHGHSFNQSIIPMHGNILDLGCRDFIFTNFFREREYKVYPVDIGHFEGGEYYRIGITDKDGTCGATCERDLDATNVCDGTDVPMMTLDTFSKHVGVARWDLIKIDIEGAEYGILWKARHPIATQVSVEFHAHCCPQTKESIDALLDYLSEWYVFYNRVWEFRSGGYNYWDLLMTAKDVIE